MVSLNGYCPFALMSHLIPFLEPSASLFVHPDSSSSSSHTGTTLTGHPKRPRRLLPLLHLLMVLSQYFHRKRSIVAGIAASGAGVGASALAPLVRYMLAALGFPWTARILGGCMVVCLGLAVCCLRPYHGSNSSTAPGPSPSSIPSGGLDFRLLRHPSFALILLATNLATLVYLVPLFLISNYITTIVGGTATQGATVFSICSAVAILARVLMGTIADRLGVLNTTTACCLFSGDSALCLWGGLVAPTTVPVTTVFMVCYGVFAGSAIVLLPVAATKAVGFVFFSIPLGTCWGRLLHRQ